MEIIPTQKIINRDGVKAVKNGQKGNQYSHIPNLKKPDWLRVKAQFNPNFHKIKDQVAEKKLNTVCEEAHCPNISECWSAGTATFMLMGSVCTRACKFCSVDTGNPKGWLDYDEPLKVFAQNIETVERLTHPVRDIRAGYQQTLDVLAESKRINPKVLTKTSLILGLGETDEEIEETMDDLIENQVDILTIGQYLRPTLNHLPIERWVTPEEFETYREIGLKKGFLEVVSGPMVRSSYRAERALEKNNAGLGKGI